MKKLIFLVLLCVSCDIKPKQEDYCVKRIEYYSQLSMIVPESAIRVYIKDKDSVLQKKMNLQILRKILFYSIKEKYRNDFHLISQEVRPFKIQSSIINIPVLTAYFRPDIFIDGVRRANKWTPQQIKKALGGDIGLVFDNDTIRIKACEKQQFMMEDDSMWPAKKEKRITL